jgi:hypothetical protein
MNQHDLLDTINKSIQELGFARIPRAAVADIFSSGEAVSFEAHEKLDEFASSHGLRFREEENFVVFEPRSAE